MQSHIEKLQIAAERAKGHFFQLQDETRICDTSVEARQVRECIDEILIELAAARKSLRATTQRSR